MTCKTCKTRNPIGNKFCRECGGPLVIPEGTLAAEEAFRAENERRTERAAILLSDAYLLAEQGKYLGAIPIAEEVIQVLPQSTSAYSLLATLFEHTDQPEKAIAAQARVVALNPHSPVDANRLERMRRGERTTAPLDRTPIRGGQVPTLRGGPAPQTLGAVPSLFPSWFPYAASAIGGGFILFIGLLTLTPGSAYRHHRTTDIMTAPSPVSLSAPAGVSSTMPLNPAAAPPPALDASRGGDPFVPLDQTRRELQSEAAQRTGTTASVNASNSSLPSLHRPTGAPPLLRTNPGPVIVSADILKPSSARNGDDDTTTLPPINAAPPTDSASGNESGFGAGSRVVAAPPTASDSDSTQKPVNGYMRITVGAPQRSAPIIATAPRPAERPADMDGDPIQRARALQSMGRYSDAISSYREAIAAGASAGDAYQAIGLCYQRLNESGSAQAAYRQAISAYQSQIAAGRSASAAQRGINSSKAALEVLGGE